MKFSTAACHPDHLWQRLFWQNCHFQVFWNLKRHPTSLSDWIEHTVVTATRQACARAEGWGEARGGGRRALAPACQPSAPTEASCLAFPGRRPGRPHAVDFRRGGLWPGGLEGYPLLLTLLQRGRESSRVLPPWMLCLVPRHPGSSPVSLWVPILDTA